MSNSNVSKHSGVAAADGGSTPISEFALVGAAMVAALVWSYWSTIDGLVRNWRNDDNYSVGQLVPFAAIYLMWTDRHRLLSCPISTCWWGVLLILAAQAARAFGFFWMFESAERYSIVLTVAGFVLLAGGWRLFGKMAAILLFLLLMVPLPGRVHDLIANPLQQFATSSAVFSLELFGVTVTREGNVILLNHSVQMAVAEACSGLRMLTAFVVVGSVLAYVIQAPRWQKVVLVLSTIPVAIVCNVVRLVVTAELFVLTTSATAERFFHDFAGLTMMPAAIGLLLAELWLLGKLVADEPVS